MGLPPPADCRSLFPAGRGKRRGHDPRAHPDELSAEGNRQPADVLPAARLLPVPGSSIFEWKGAASYFALAREPGDPIAWTYARPRPRFDRIRNFIAFYPGRIACYVDGDRVEPQPGRFYGGWITSDVVGPFKGEPGTGHW